MTKTYEPGKYIDHTGDVAIKNSDGSWHIIFSEFEANDKVNPTWAYVKPGRDSEILEEYANSMGGWEKIRD